MEAKTYYNNVADIDRHAGNVKIRFHVKPSQCHIRYIVLKIL